MVHSQVVHMVFRLLNNIIMMKFGNIFFIFSVLFITCCKNPDKNPLLTIEISGEDTVNINKSIINGFDKYDRPLIKLNKINKERDVTYVLKKFLYYDQYKGNYYDIIIKGISLKFYYSEELNHNFSLIRNSKNEYFYFAPSDQYRYQKKLKYIEINNKLELENIDTLVVLRDSASIEAKYLQDIINSDSVFIKETKTESASFCIKHLFINLYKYIYNSFWESNFSMTYFVYPGSITDDLKKLYKTSSNLKNNSSNLERVTKILMNIVNQPNSFGIFIKINNYGIIGYIITDININHKKYKIEKYFIPQLEKGLLYSL